MTKCLSKCMASNFFSETTMSSFCVSSITISRYVTCWVSISCQTWHDNRYVMLRESGKKWWFPYIQTKEVLQIHPFRSDLSFVLPSYFIATTRACCYVFSFACFYIPHIAFVFEKLHSRQLVGMMGLIDDVT